MAKKELPHFLLIYGNQPFLMDQAIEDFTAAVLGPRDRENALLRFDAAEMNRDNQNETSQDKLDQFHLAWESMSFFSDRILIRLDRVDKLKMVRGAAAEDGDSPRGGGKFYQSLLKYLDHEVEHVWCVLIAEASKESEISSPLLKAIKKGGEILKFVGYDNDSPVVWLMQQAQKMDLLLSRPIAQLFVELAGNDHGILAGECEKLSLLFPKNHQLSEEDLTQNLQSNRHFTVFRITQSLADKKLAPALETLAQYLLEYPREQVRLFALIVQQFRKLLLFHTLKKNGVSDKDIQTKLGLHPYFAKQFFAQAQHFSMAELCRIHQNLADLDIPMKFQSKHAEVLLQDLFCKICY